MLHRSDGAIIDVEMLRPDAWIVEIEIEPRRVVPMVLDKLDFLGLAMVKAVGVCPLIAGMPLTPGPSPVRTGEGSKEWAWKRRGWLRAWFGLFSPTQHARSFFPQPFLLEKQRSASPLARSSGRGAGGEGPISTTLDKPLHTPIERVPLGSRVATKNPRPWEFDGSLAEPEQGSWSKIDFVLYRSDGAIIDVQMLWPDAWLIENEIETGRAVPLVFEEL